MIKKLSQAERRGRRHVRLRKRVFGTADKPRLAVFRSQKHVYAQLIDDGEARTLVAASSLEEMTLPEVEQPAEPAPQPKQEKAKQEKGKKKPAKAEEKQGPVSHKPMLTARAVGALIAKKAIEKGITQVVFDRGGFQFHGRVKALADAARASGLKF